MKTNKVYLGLMMATLVSAGCVSFNRDALWNAPISGEYCTYYEEDFPKGSLFVHSENDWTDKRLSYGYELKVEDIDDGWVILDHGWSVLTGYKDVLRSYDTKLPFQEIRNSTWLKTVPIAIKVLDPNEVKKGELFKVYGQYKYVSDARKKYKGNQVYMKHLVQINRSQEPVVEPYPFIYIR